MTAATMTDGIGSESYAYNNLGQMTQLQKIIDGTIYTTGCGTATSPFATGYGYNASNQMTGLKYGNVTATVSA